MNFLKLKRVIANLLMIIAAFAVIPVSVVALERPAGAQLVLQSECRIDFIESTYWTGQAEDLAEQVSWLVGQLPEECWEEYCVFTNIDLFSYSRLRNVRFLEGLDPEYANALAEKFRQCWVAVNTPPSLVRSESGVVCVTGNTFVLTTSGSNNTVVANQSGCNIAYITIIGNNVYVNIQQSGSNGAWLEFVGDNISLNLLQQGNRQYHGTFTGGENITITQVN